MATAYDNWKQDDSKRASYESDRDAWIAKRAADLFTEYRANPIKRNKAVEEFMTYIDTTGLDLSLRLFMAAYENARAAEGRAEAANDLAKSLRSYIDPILTEWAEDAAIEEFNRMEAAESADLADRRSAA